MRNPIRVWSTVAVLAALHFLIHLGFGIGRGAPDLLTIGLLIGARELRMDQAAFLGLGFGLLEDAFSVLAFGANTIAMTLVGAAGARTRTLFVGDSLLFVVSYLVGGKWLRDMIFWVVAGEAVRGPFTDAVLVSGSLAAGYAALVGLAAVWASGAWGEAR